VQNVEIGAVLEGSRSPKVTGNVTIQQSIYDVLFDFDRNYIYLVRFSSYCELFVKSHLF